MKNGHVELDWNSDKPIGHMYMPEYIKIAEEKSLRPTSITGGVMDFAPEGEASASRNKFMHKVRRHLRGGGQVSQAVYDVFQLVPTETRPQDYSSETLRGLEGDYPIIR